MNFYEAWRAMKDGKIIRMKDYPDAIFRYEHDLNEKNSFPEKLYWLGNGKNEITDKHETHYLNHWMNQEWEIVE